MATQNNTIKTRIQLKSDTEANWNKAGAKAGSNGFVPLSGELIVYTPDATHPFSRLKVGDGVTNVTQLPFIDAGTLNGKDSELVKYQSRIDFPSPGSINKLYLALETNRLYYFDAQKGYVQLANFEYEITKNKASYISYWNPGYATENYVDEGTLHILIGQPPLMSFSNNDYITNITKVVN